MSFIGVNGNPRRLIKENWEYPKPNNSLSLFTIEDVNTYLNGLVEGYLLDPQYNLENDNKILFKIQFYSSRFETQQEYDARLAEEKKKEEQEKHQKEVYWPQQEKKDLLVLLKKYGNPDTWDENTRKTIEKMIK